MLQKSELPELVRIDQEPSYAAALREVTALEQRLVETEQRRQRAKARLRGVKPASTPLERAKKLLAGGQIGAADPADDLKACDCEEFEILLPSIREATARLDQVHGASLLAASEKIRPAFVAAINSALQAMHDLAAALDTLGAARSRLRELGYTPAEGILPSGVPHAAHALGSPDAVGNSQAWVWKDQLARHGVI